MREKREQILSEGLDLLTEIGFRNLTIASLAQRTGMSKSGLFAHFGSKEQVQLDLLEETVRVGAATFIAPAIALPPGLARLRALVKAWLGWTREAGLRGGCPIAAGLFEFDDAPKSDLVRQRLLALEKHWRGVLVQTTKEAVENGELDVNCDLDQFVWELCGIYLSHHASTRFIDDPLARVRANRAFELLIDRNTRKDAPRRISKSSKRVRNQ